MLFVLHASCHSLVNESEACPWLLGSGMGGQMCELVLLLIKDVQRVPHLLKYRHISREGNSSRDSS